MPLVGPFSSSVTAAVSCGSSASAVTSSTSAALPCPCPTNISAVWSINFTGCNCLDTTLTSVGGTYLNGETICTEYRKDGLFISVFCEPDSSGGRQWVAIINGDIVATGHASIVLTRFGCTLSGSFAAVGCGFVTMVITIAEPDCTNLGTC